VLGRDVGVASKPGAAKALGRTVRSFDDKRWEQHRFNIVGKVLVEASPVDRVWGIGLAADDPRAERPTEWQGLNLLGFALMRARTMLAERER
jgi:predicted NAD-dependent protein-ADP-ribosyltransferase YbiA (DUF1768 family)